MSELNSPDPLSPYVQVLGIAQDGGYPQAGCRRPCCAKPWQDSQQPCSVAALGIVDPVSGECWLIDCTPDFPRQLAMLQHAGSGLAERSLAGILLTHAHMGHYTGLVYLGKEAMSARAMPVYAMQRMQGFLQQHQPWAALCQQEHLQLRDLEDHQVRQLNERLQVMPLLVPHRAEFSETIALIVSGPSGRVLWLPDIDAWDNWQPSIEALLSEVDVAYLDGTFFDADELAGRSLGEVPHPLVSETMQRLSSLPETARGKVRFVHLNHTNALFDPTSSASQEVRRAGYHVAHQGEWQSV